MQAIVSIYDFKPNKDILPILKQLFSSLNGEKVELFVHLYQTHATHMCNIFAESKPLTTSQVQVPPTLQVQVPSTQQVVHSTPQIVPSMVEKPVIQGFVPPALNKFRQKNPKGRLKLGH